MNSTNPLSHASLNKKAIVSLGDGKRLGSVSDLLIDPQKLTLSAIEINGDEGRSVLPVGNIRSVGEDAITVDGVSSTQSSASSMPGLRRFSDLRGHNVVDSNGTLAGQLHDILFDANTHLILFLEVNRGGVFGIGSDTTRVAVGEVCSLGPELITVGSTANNPSS